MTKYTLGGFIKHLHTLPEDYYYLCPKDIFPVSSQVVTLREARRKLALIDLHWKQQGIKTTYHIWGEGMSSFWDEDELRHKKAYVIRISVDNEKIQEFASSMNTMGD